MQIGGEGAARKTGTGNLKVANHRSMLEDRRKLIKSMAIAGYFRYILTTG
jgi:hypothetical protein